MERAGVHSFLRMSRQMAPVAEEMLGCQILVSNFIWGSGKGYLRGVVWVILGKLDVDLELSALVGCVFLNYNVVTAPFMVAFQWKRLSLMRFTLIRSF